MTRKKKSIVDSIWSVGRGNLLRILRSAVDIDTYSGVDRVIRQVIADDTPIDVINHTIDNALGETISIAIERRR